MSFANDYDNAERTLFLSKDRVLDSGKPYYRLQRSFCFVILQNVGYFETIHYSAANIVDTDSVTVNIPNKFVSLQVIEDIDAPVCYDSDGIVNEFHQYI